MSSPDYFNNKCADKKFGTIPSKYWGGQRNESGAGYAGVVACFDHKTLKQTDPGAEYLQVKLTEPLVKGQKYIVKASFSLAECSKAAVKNIGFYFSPVEVKTRAVGLLKFTPQVISNCNLKDTLHWNTSINEFVANGGEQYLILGCFNTGKLPEMESVKPSPAIADPRDYAYYFIDNVSVELVEASK